MIALDKFKRIFRGSFWKVLRNSLVPYRDGELPESRDNFLTQLHYDIEHSNYAPANPREYIVQNKDRYVARIVPALTCRDNCVYFFCIKLLEDHIALNRVEGTFGGWKLGNPLRKLEEEEIPYGLSIPLSSYNPKAWMEHWREFQKKAFQYSQLADCDYFIKFDIANFYDSINLQILEHGLRLCADADKGSVIDLLFNFLSYWNRRFHGYTPKTVGIPQDEINDCSRILSNFYLQGYDKAMYDLCIKHGGRFLRYADDQIIYAPSQSVARDILFEASKELFKIGLNINASKVVEFDSPEAFNTYWAFEVFELLGEPKDKKKVKRAVEIFLDWKKNNVLFRAESVMRRLLAAEFSILPSRVQSQLLAMVHDLDFLARSTYWFLRRVAHQTPSKKELYSTLDELVEQINFNSYHYNLLQFNKRLRRKKDNTHLLERIQALKLQVTPILRLSHPANLFDDDLPF